MFIPRLVSARLQSEIETKEAVVITGMRQVGKTTLLRHLFETVPSSNKAFLDIGNPLHRKIFEEENFDAIWNNLAFHKVSNTQKAYLFLDEVQNLPTISQAVKYLGDHWPVKFFLTGSSSYYLKNLFSESLSGRKLIFELFPLTFQEFLAFKKVTPLPETEWSAKDKKKNKITHEQYLPFYREFMEFGGFPAVVLETNVDRKRYLLEDIFRSYFEQDVKSLADFSDLSKLRDLILLLVCRIGSKVDISKLSVELQISRTTIYDYLSFLEQTYFLSLLSPFSRSFDRQAAGSKKVFFADCGLANFLGKLSLGQLFENSIFQNLRPESRSLHFFSRDESEIDFIVEEKIALEAKLTGSAREVTNLRKKSQTIKIKESYLVSLNWTKENQGIIMAPFL